MQYLQEIIHFRLTFYITVIHFSLIFYVIVIQCQVGVTLGRILLCKSYRNTLYWLCLNRNSMYLHLLILPRRTRTLTILLFSIKGFANHTIMN